MSAFDTFSAADTVRMQAGDSSVFETLGNGLTYGVGAAVISGIHSIINTGIDYSNKVFGTTAERYDTAEVLGNLDTKWGDYYSDNKSVIDTAGFVAGSFIPGTLAIKGLKAVQSGQSFGAFGRALGYTMHKENAYLKEALTTIGADGGTVFARINAAKHASMAWGVADSVLQTAAWETATALTMNASPMLDKEDWKDISWDIMKTSVFGGVIGGGINAIFTNKLIKDAGAAVGKKLRQFDVLENYGKVDLHLGDTAFSQVEAVLALPEDALNTIVKLHHSKAGIPTELDVGGVLDKAKKKSIEVGVQKLTGTLNNVVGEDASVGTAFSKGLIDLFRRGLEEGGNKEEIRGKLAGVLMGLRSVEAIGSRPTTEEGVLRYFNAAATIDSKEGIFTSVPPVFTNELGTAKPVIKQYRVTGNEAAARMAVIGKDVSNHKEAWELGYDFVLSPNTKTIAINNKSTIYREVTAKEEGTSQLFYNTRTGKTGITAVPTIADIATAAEGKAGGLVVTSSGVTSGNRTMAFSTADNALVTGDSVEATARHLWADELKIIGGNIKQDDISLLDSLLKNPGKAADGLVLEGNGTSVLFTDVAERFEDFVFKQKVAKLQEILLEGATDYRDLAYRLNVTPEWIEHAVATKFDKKELFTQGGWKEDAARFRTRENLIVRYDTAALKLQNNFPEAQIAYATRVKEAHGRAKDAATAVLDKHADRFLDPAESIARLHDDQAVGATFLKSSDADYGDPLRLFTQHTGAQVTEVIKAQTTEVLSAMHAPAAAIVQNPKAAAELVALTEKVRSTAEPLGLHRDAHTGQLHIVDYVSLERSKKGELKFIIDFPVSKEVGEFVKTYHRLHELRAEKQQVLMAAQGIEARWKPDMLHLPPVDTRRYPYFAFVRQHEGALFGTSEVSMITAKSAAELQTLASQVEETGVYRVIFKKDSELYHKAQADYDFSRALNAPQINSDLQKRGILSNFMPNMTPEAIIGDYMQHTQKAETKLVRDAVSVRYAQSIAELEDLSARYSAAQTSKFEGLGKLLQRNVTDPYKDAIKTMLGVSKQAEFTLWHQANELVDAMGKRAWDGIGKGIIDAREGKITWEEGNAMLKRFGLNPAYSSERAFEVAQTAPERNLVKSTLQKANLLIANSMLRLDFANSLLNIISTPIMLSSQVSALRNSLKNDPELLAKLAGDLSLTVPGTATVVPNTTKLIAQSISNMFGESGKELFKRFERIGVNITSSQQVHAMLDDLSLKPGLIPSKFSETVEKWVEKGSKLTFNTQAESFTRFVSADVMRQITEPAVKAGRMSIQEQDAFISIFVNRVQGNYVASQRPILFQGTLGGAVSLFQTYQFNLLQQLFRHIENRDLKTLAVFGGMQTSLFGLNGLPFFQAVNTHIIGNASINDKHEDIYSYVTRAAGKELGDWAMYGTASAFPLFSEQAPALWTRGDMNPRSATIIPTSFKDVPAVAVSTKLAAAVAGMATQVSNGADASSAFLHGLEHNGISRPLAGIAQVLKGNSTTSKGNLISASQDWASIATLSRIAGAKPMDESIALTQQYRSSAYKAVDKERLDELGLVVKDKLRNHRVIEPEEIYNFQAKYAAAGGRAPEFYSALQRWSSAANESGINAIMRHNQTVAGQRMIEIMGGDPLPDYRNQNGMSSSMSPAE